MKREHYVYIYLNPLKKGDYVYGKFKFDYEPFYVGLGKNDRINEHFKPYSLKYNSLKNNIILKILKNDINPIRFKLYENITLESAKRLERCLIKLIGRRDLNKGTLSNLTDGGEGMKGFLYSDEAKEKMRLRSLGEKNVFYGKTHSEESKEKIRTKIGDSRKGELNANFNNKWSDEFKNQASIKQKETHKHLTGENNPSKREDVRKVISEGKMGLLNPNSKKWLLINPDGEEFIIEGGIDRNLAKFGLYHQPFRKTIEDEKIRKNWLGWILKEI
jgi:hypothetical protein